MVEYALIIALVSAVAIAVFTNIGTKIVDKFKEAENAPTLPSGI